MRYNIVNQTTTRRWKMTRISRQFIESVVVGCVEGVCSNNWAWFSGYKPGKPEVTVHMRKEEIEEGIQLGEFEEGDDFTFRVTSQVIRRGVQTILGGETDLPSETVRAYASQWRRVDFDVDSVAADIILQAGIFGKVIFG